MFTRFRLLLAATIIILVGLIGLFTLLNLTSSPHVKNVKLVGTKEEAQLRNQRLQLRFSRPIAKDYKQNIAKYITLTPSAPVKTVWTGNQLTIILQEPLQAASAYKLTLSKDIKDSYGDTFARDFNYQFTTRSQKLYYIERNFPQANDRIIETDAELNEKTQIYTSSNEILRFNKQANLLAVIEAQANESKKLKLLNLATGKAVEPMAGNEDVFQAKFSQRSGNLYILSQKFTIEDKFMVPQTGRALYVYNLEQERLHELKFGNTFTDIDEFFLAPDERAIVIKDAVTLFYYLIDLTNPEVSVSLGKYLSTGGFNQAGNLIVFNNIDLGVDDSQPYVMTINGQREKQVLTDGLNYAVDPVFLPSRANLMAYAVKAADYPDTKGLSKIVIVDDQGKQQSEISKEQLGLEIPLPSIDGRFIAFEAYTIPALQDYQNQRSLSYQAKPYVAEIMVYDRNSNTIYERGVRGIEAFWE